MPMANYLKMQKRQQVLALLELGWTYRRIESETGVRRETVSRYDRLRQSNAAKVFPGSDAWRDREASESGLLGGAATANPAKVFLGSESKAAKVFPGSAGPARSAAAAYHEAIVEKLESGLTIQRVWQDLVEEYGYGHSYESVKRYTRGLRKSRRVVGVFHSAPGDEAQVDFFRGAPTLKPETGQWQRPWVFRMTLCHSRHGYEEAVWSQKLEEFLRCHENAFRDLGGVPRVVRHDNLKSAVVRACLYDPDSNEIYAAFAKHWGFTPLPTRPRNPQENGKQERSGGYVKSNALRGRRFDSLEEQNAHLRHWNRSIARLRIHGTTRRQVWTHFLESEKPTLQALPSEGFALFECGSRSVHPDGHVVVAGAFYPAPVHLIGRKLRVRWDDRLVRLYFEDTLLAVYRRQQPGTYAARSGREPAQAPYAQRAFVDKLLGRCRQVGPELHEWAQQALEERGVRAIRLIQGVLGLTRTHPRERLCSVAEQATTRRLFRYRDLKRLAELAAERTSTKSTLIATHPSIRSMDQYCLGEFE
jgi:transposase